MKIWRNGVTVLIFQLTHWPFGGRDRWRRRGCWRCFFMDTYISGRILLENSYSRKLFRGILSEKFFPLVRFFSLFLLIAKSPSMDQNSAFLQSRHSSEKNFKKQRFRLSSALLLLLLMQLGHLGNHCLLVATHRGRSPAWQKPRSAQPRWCVTILFRGQVVCGNLVVLPPTILLRWKTSKATRTHKTIKMTTTAMITNRLFFYFGWKWFWCDGSTPAV